MSKLFLKKNPTLEDFQEYVVALDKERGFTKGTVLAVLVHLMEECGELAKAIRKAEGMRTDKKSEQFDVAHEAADVFIFLLKICNRFNINLEQAFRDKEEINKKRVWK
ncbi:MAG: MazG nucleotide pyrophosphohydrolase domain-containing protein [Candidatus Moraniibacteriota bacterium]